MGSRAGTVVDGRQSAFAILARQGRATGAAPGALDAVVVALARCGCR